MTFLNTPSVYCRNFLDYSNDWNAQTLNFYTDSLRNFNLGFGGISDNQWMIGSWDEFTKHVNPSIEYLELYAVMAAVIAWIAKYPDRKIILFCDNQSVVDMINNSTSSCRNCMILIRLITLQGLIHNVRIFARHVRGIQNKLSDALSRHKLSKFWEIVKCEGRAFEEKPTPIPGEIWPLQKVWLH